MAVPDPEPVAVQASLTRPVGPETASDAAPGPLTLATRAELASAGRVETPAGQQALMLAERLDAGQDTGSGIAALSRELRATMVVAMADAQKVESELDKLRRLRAGRLGA